MEANIYDQPAQARFLNTYVPINFDQLYRIGATQKQEVDRAVQDLSGRVQKWSEFKSPSSKDTSEFYNKSIGVLKEDISHFAANPDDLKTAEGRYRLQSKINNLDYSGLAQLRQSSENLTQRQRIIAEMKAKGLYNENWDDVNISQWDTSTGGIMNDLSPTQYKSLHDIAAPYTQALKPSYLGKKDAFHYWEGVDEKAIRGSINTHYADFINTPQGKYHMRDIARQFQMEGIQPTTENVQEEFVNRMAQSQKDYINVNQVEDRVALSLYAADAKSETEKQPGTVYSPREQLSASIKSGVASKMGQSPAFGPQFNEKTKQLSKQAYEDFTDINDRATKQDQLYKEAISRGDKEGAAKHKKAYEKLFTYANTHAAYLNQQAYDQQSKGFKQELDSAYGMDISKLNKDNVNRSAFNRISVGLLDKYSADITQEDSERTFKLQSPKTVLKLESYVVDGFKADSKDLILPQDLATDLAGVSIKPGINKPSGARFHKPSLGLNGGDDNFVANWRAGNIQNITYVPQSKATVYTNAYGVTVEAAKVKAYIPMESIYSAGYKKNIGSQSILNRMINDMNAKVETGADGKTYVVVDTYKQMNTDPQTSHQFDRSASNQWYGTKTSDTDRDYQIQNAYSDIE